LRKSVLMAVTLVLLAQAAHAALVVSTGANSKVRCASGTCTATAADAVLNITKVRRLLRAGDLTIASGSKAKDIVFDATLNWTSASRLTLDANRAIVVDQPLTAQGTGGVTLTTNDGGTGGDYTFTGAGRISFWDLSSSLVIDGQSHQLVNTLAELATAIANHPSSPVALAQGYDASVDGTYNQAPVHTDFHSTFEGLGHAISNLSVSVPGGGGVGSAGLFATIQSDATVRDLAIVHMTGTIAEEGGAGALAGDNLGTVRHVSGDATIKVGEIGNGGALVGSNLGLIDHCTGSGSIVGRGKDAEVGGLVGDNFEGTIAASSSSADAQASLVGGLAGRNEGNIALSFATGHVVGTIGGHESPRSGGLVGLNNGPIETSFATGTVDGGDGHMRGHDPEYAYAGGLIGVNSGAIADSYARGAVNVGALGYAGGFAGAGAFSGTGGSVVESYSTGPVGAGAGSFAAGFVADPLSGTAAGDYWDTETSGATAGCVSACSGVTGLTTAQFLSGLPSGFEASVWAQDGATNGGYPYLVANAPE
jgi:hypothetical protein